MTGKVRYWLDLKGWGFITTDEGSDVFVHYKEILGHGRRNLEDGQQVVFEVKQTPKGPRAFNVQSADQVEADVR